MTLPEQSAIVLQAFENQFLKPEDIIRWTDNVIVPVEKPPALILDLSTLDRTQTVEMVSHLRTLASTPLSMRRKIQLIILAHHSGLLSLLDTLPKIFEIAISEPEESPFDALNERLMDALVYWDCQEDLDVIEPPLLSTFTELFREYLNGADEIAAVLSWKFTKPA